MSIATTSTRPESSGGAAASGTTVSVVICAYTMDRWDDLLASVDSMRRQDHQPLETIVVADHNDELLARLRAEVAGVVAVANTETRGLSGARNSGVRAARGAVVAFIDDDAFADAGWLERLVAAYADDRVVGVGGEIQPLWETSRPGWFPPEFDWVIGCTYRGLPTTRSPVRNFIGCNMSFRRNLFHDVGGFRSEIGRVGTVPVGCEETELCIRAAQSSEGAVLVYEPAARVHHRVPRARGTWRYFLARCRAEGRSKALVSALVGSRAGLETERGYALRVLPLGAVRPIADAVRRRDLSLLGRPIAIALGLATTTFGYLEGLVRPERGRLRGLAALPPPNVQPVQDRSA